MPDTVNVLLVEDDETDVELIRRLFKKENIDNPLYHASNGVEALDIIRGRNNTKQIPRPYIILLDINMPMMNGIEMLKDLRSDEATKDSVVFVLTTSPREEDKNTTYKLNIAGYFLKRDVRELISLLTLYWRLNEFPLVKKT